MSIKFLDLHKQYLSIKDEIDSAISAVIDSSSFIGGTYVERFEEEFARFQQAKYCIGVGNGTDALEISIEALDLPKGSEIIVPANSFIASSEAVSRSGCRVVFCDCDARDYTICPDDLVRRITKNTAAVIAVHLYGHPCNMDRLLEISEANNLKIIEDCAQAHGAEYKGRRVGSIGDIAGFSFYPGKNLGAYGDGGAVTTNSKDLASRVRKIANHGRIGKYDHEFEGRNSRLDGLQAAILSVKLKHLDCWITKRTEVADRYLKKLGGVGGLVLPIRREWANQAYHLFIVRHGNRSELKKYLDGKDIQTGIHYPVSLNNLESYAYIKQENDCSVASHISTKILSLPIGEHMNCDMTDYVIESIIDYHSI